MRQIALALALIAAASAARATEKLPLADISGYLNRLGAVRTGFTQVNDDGSLSTGRLWMQRPGKMRLEYDPPEAAMVLVHSGTVFIEDRKSNQPPEQYPLSRTPLSLILARRVDLGRANMVVGHDFDGTATIVTAQDPDNPEYGRIELMFTDEPVELRKWVVQDGTGNRTTVLLGALEETEGFASSLFRGRSRPSDNR